MSLSNLEHAAQAPPPASAGATRSPHRSLPGLGSLAAWLVAAYVLATAGLLAALLWQLREEAITAAKRELAAFAQLTAGHTYEVALSLEDALKLVEVTLSVTAGAAAADEQQISLMLRDVAANARGLQDILVLDAAGRVVHQANGRSEIGRDWSDRLFVQRFQRDPGLKFDIGAATRLDGGGAADWFMPVVHAWRGADGRLAGVIVGLMSPEFFAKAWTFDSEIAGLSIALGAVDGTALMRRPFAPDLIGRPLLEPDARARLSPALATAALQQRNPADGQAQLLAYRPVAAYPNLAIFVAQPLELALEGWWRVVWIVAASWLVASLALGSLGAWLAREMRARGALQTRYHALFNAIPYPVIVADRDGQRIIAFNDATIGQYAWAASPGAAGGDARLPEELALLSAGSRDFSRNATTVIQGQKHRNREGQPIDVELTVRPIDYNGRPATLTIAVDVSDRLKAERAQRSAEEQLRQSQKMDVLGQLTGGIAHDFNNILMVVLDAVETLGERNSLDAEAKAGLDSIADAAQRAEDLTRQMLAFSRKQPLRPRPLNVNDLVADTGKLLRRTLGGEIEVDSILADDLWTVEIDPAQLETSLVNLCLNARDAMPRGGRVLIETRNVTRDAAMVAQDPGAPEGEFVLIAVTDTGQGILPQHLDKVFEPFFTTKAQGKSSGLGLSMVYGFVRQSHGHIAVTSEVDRGTSFHIWLPRHAGAVAPNSAARSTALAGGSERVLVVEDDPLVRTSVVRQLASLGYAVEQADSGTAGLAAFQAARPPFDLLLSDVVMPGGMNGRELAEEVSRLSPRTAVVFMSGFSNNLLTYGGRSEAEVHLLAKPFRKSDLAAMLRLALDETGGGHG